VRIALQIKSSSCLCWLLGLLLSAAAYSDLLVQEAHSQRQQIPVFDASSNAIITLQHESFAAGKRLSAVLVQRAAALSTVLDEREVTDCKPNTNGHLEFGFLTAAVAREARQSLALSDKNVAGVHVLFVQGDLADGEADL
jgi:hypothetical protein